MSAGDRSEAMTQNVLPRKKSSAQVQEPHFASDDEFEAFWDKLEQEAEAERAQRHAARNGNSAVSANQERSVEAPNESAETPKGATDPATEPSETCADPAHTPATFVDAVGSVETDGAYDHLMAVIRNRPLASELLRRTLVLCETRMPYAQVEDAIQQFPEYACASMTPYQVISSLIGADGLRKLEIGFDGEEVLPEMKAGLSDDEADDLVESYALVTTDLGRIAAQDISPVRRLAEVFSSFADRADVFQELLAFCDGEARTYADIERLLAGRDFSGIASLNPQVNCQIQPSVFVDNLEKAGGLVWDGGWRATPEGIEMLERLAS